MPTHTGSLKSLPLTYQYVWDTWSLTTRERLDSGEEFELYDERFLGPYHPDSQADIYIPVQQSIQAITCMGTPAPLPL